MTSAIADYSFETELDVYYSNIGYYQSLTDKQIPDVGAETRTYHFLLDSITLVPRFKGEERKVKNRGYTRFLLSVGDQHYEYKSAISIQTAACESEGRSSGNGIRA